MQQLILSHKSNQWFSQEKPAKNKDYLLYGTSNAKNNILKWTFHINHHVQQNKAKTNISDVLSETTGLWIRN